jgi:hypothetical protein
VGQFGSESPQRDAQTPELVNVDGSNGGGGAVAAREETVTNCL